MKRRQFIKNSVGILIAAPMVVRADSLMKIVVPLTIEEELAKIDKCIEGKIYALLAQQSKNPHNNKGLKVLDEIKKIIHNTFEKSTLFNVA